MRAGRKTGLRQGRWRLAAAGALTLMGFGVAPGCTYCQPAEITVTALDRSALDVPVTVEARMSSEGKAVTGATIGFYLITQGPTSEWQGMLLGSAVTDGTGHARLVLAQAPSTLTPVGHQIRGLGGHYDSAAPEQPLACTRQGRYAFS